MIMSKDPMVTARQACQRQALETWPSVLNAVNKGLAEGPLSPWPIRGPQYFLTPSSELTPELEAPFECNSISVAEVSLIRRAHRKQWPKIHHQAWISLFLTSEAMEPSALTLDLSDVSQPAWVTLGDCGVAANRMEGVAHSGTAISRRKLRQITQIHEKWKSGTCFCFVLIERSGRWGRARFQFLSKSKQTETYETHLLKKPRPLGLVP